MRALLLLLACVSLPSLADLDYRLAPRQIAAGTYVLEGSTEHFPVPTAATSSTPVSSSPRLAWW